MNKRSTYFLKQELIMPQECLVLEEEETSHVLIFFFACRSFRLGSHLS